MHFDALLCWPPLHKEPHCDIAGGLACSPRDFWKGIQGETIVQSSPWEEKGWGIYLPECIIQPFGNYSGNPIPHPMVCISCKCRMEELLNSNRTQHVVQETQANLSLQLWFCLKWEFTKSANKGDSEVIHLARTLSREPEKMYRFACNKGHKEETTYPGMCWKYSQEDFLTHLQCRFVADPMSTGVQEIWPQISVLPPTLRVIKDNLISQTLSFLPSVKWKEQYSLTIYEQGS